MTISKLPETICPLHLAKVGKVLSGDYYLHKLPRINSLLEIGEDNQVSFKLEFFKDNDQIFRILGTVKTVLSLLCQRCLQPMQQQIDEVINLAIVNDDLENESLSAQFECYEDTGKMINLQNFVEDELLLAMSLVPLHAQEMCLAKDNFVRNDG